MPSATRRLFVFFLLCFILPALAEPVPDSRGEWTRLTKEAARMGLPSRFLRLLPPGFVTLEFADLKNVAAEYHPDGHRMVLHLALSEGGRGKRLRPLRKIGNRDLATLYHELFHAYFDYVDSASGASSMTAQGARLHAEAKRLAACRYTIVEVGPVSPQQGSVRKATFEKRRLTEREAWEALNETWGVFVGWAVWTELETTDRLKPAHRWDWDTQEQFLDRLDEASSSGALTGYFEPAGQDERKGVPRWHLAPRYAISAPEVALLLEVILEESPGMAKLAAAWSTAPAGQPALDDCQPVGGEQK